MKTAKYCLRIQNKDLEKLREFTCEFCNKSYIRKYDMQIHQKNCNRRDSFIIHTLYEKLNSKDLYIETLQQQLEERDKTIFSLASQAIENAKPNITNNTHNKNTYINMLTPLPTQEKLNELIQNGFERKYFVRGQIGLAEFINDCIVRDDKNSMYYLICSDTARQVFRFKDKCGNVIKDPCMKQFTNMIVEPVKLKTEEHLQKIEDVDPLYIDRAREIAREFYKLNKDNSELSKALSALIPNQTMIIN
jgi:hypothetical protein